MPDFTEMQRNALVRHLRRNIAGEVRFEYSARRLYSTDASIYQMEPLGVVIPTTVNDLRAIVQIAAEMRVPITARGGGTSLSGQSIGPGIVIDTSKYLNRILDLDPTAGVARVQPGLVLDELNREAARHGLQFGPDVATANRATLGGMIGNNSSGSRSIVYGKTDDHVRRLRGILADGSEVEFGPVSAHDWQLRSTTRTLEGGIYRTAHRVVQEHSAEIERRYPRILRRVSGYNLDALQKKADTSPDADSRGLVPLLVGSEGTLALTAEAELGLIPVPRVRGLLVPHFSSLAAAMDAVAACLELRPSAVELLDQMLIDLARANLALKDQMAVIRGRPAALLMVEFSSDDSADVTDRVKRLERRLGEVNGVSAIVPALDSAVREPLWNLRRAGLPLLYGLPGDQKPVTFVEDTAVHPARLPEFVARFREVLKRHGTDGAFYGHASVGCLHIRPLLDLKQPADVRRMRQIAEDITDLVLEFGGALSGEHGDGLARSEWNRKMFGPVLYEAFREIKHAFDPHHILNPGKVVDAPPMTDHLRYGAGYSPAEPDTQFVYPRQKGFIRAIEACNGSGVCRKPAGGTMCPSFRATRDEKDSTRGRANALRLALAGEQPLKDLRSPWVHQVLDLCLMCKACKAECPANVDMAKLKAEFLELHYQGRLRPLGHRLMAHVHTLNRLTAPVAPVMNWLQERATFRWLLEKTAGVDRRRTLPRLHADHLRRWFATHVPKPSEHRRGRVILLDDCFTTYQEPAIGQAAVRLLEQAGYEVELAGLACCGRAMISKGFLSSARVLIQDQAAGLARRMEDGTPLLGLEPSCLLTLCDEWTELLPGWATKAVADGSELIEDWMARQPGAGSFELSQFGLPKKCLVHGHCHQKALRGCKGTVKSLSTIPGLEVVELDVGCCGMAGSFGYERDHYDLSVSIANLALIPELEKEPQALVVASGTSCRHQIRDLTGRRALHPVELLAYGCPNSAS